MLNARYCSVALSTNGYVLCGACIKNSDSQIEATDLPYARRNKNGMSFLFAAQRWLCGESVI
ncbi:hypothetical protein ALT721_1360045 [Alteromonas alvinellae]